MPTSISGPIGASRWGCEAFQLTLEGLDEPVRELAKTLQERGVALAGLRAAERGESLTPIVP
jgi:hypothetical protein